MTEITSMLQCQTPVTCEVCKTDNDIMWYCLHCKGRICIGCKTNHGSLPLHTVVPTEEVLHKKLNEPEKCSRHPSLQYTLHCEDCTTLVCIDCVIKDHKGHVLGSIPETIGKIQEEIKKLSDHLQSTVLKDYKSQDETLTDEITKCESWYKTIESNVNKSGAELKNEIDRVCDSILKEAMKEKQRHITPITETKQSFQKTIGELQHLVKRAEDVNELTDSQKIDFYKGDLDISDLNVPKYKSDLLCLPEFVPGKVNTAEIKEQIGKLQKREYQQEKVMDENIPKVEIITNHTLKFARIFSIFPISSTEVFIGSPDSNKIQLVNISGDVTKQITTMFNTYGFVVMATGEVIVTDYRNNCIKILKQTGDVTQIVYTDTWKPTGLSLGKDRNNILVCLNSKNESKSKLVIYGNDWAVLLSIQYTEKAVGLHVQQNVTQNKNGDYCIVHTGQRTIFVLDSKGVLRFSYDESNCVEMKNFSPVSACCDSNLNILITDCYNRTIHILDQNGKFLRFLKNELIGFGDIHGMNIDAEGKLWIGHGDDKLCVIKY